LAAIGVHLCAAASVWAAPLLTNSDFSARSDADPALPAAWVLPPASAWHATNEDGHSGQDALRYRSRQQTLAKPVTQAATLTPNTAYVLTAALKCDVRIKPFLRVRGAGEDGPELARLEGAAAAGAWQMYEVRFRNATATRVVVEL